MSFLHDPLERRGEVFVGRVTRVHLVKSNTFARMHKSLQESTAPKNVTQAMLLQVEVDVV